MPSRDPGRTARALRDRLGLAPHPEGGWYRETWRAAHVVTTPWGTRPAGTSIVYMLAAGQVSRWHRLRQDEVWSFHDGAGLFLHQYAEGGRHEIHTLGPAASLQVTVPAGVWMGAEPAGAWAIVGCACAPGFEFGDLTFADPAMRLPSLPSR